MAREDLKVDMENKGEKIARNLRTALPALIEIYNLHDNNGYGDPATDALLIESLEKLSVSDLENLVSILPFLTEEARKALKKIPIRSLGAVG